MLHFQWVYRLIYHQLYKYRRSLTQGDEVAAPICEWLNRQRLPHLTSITEESTTCVLYIRTWNYWFKQIKHHALKQTRPWFHGRVMEELRAVMGTHADQGSNFSRWQSKQLQQCTKSKSILSSFERRKIWFWKYRKRERDLFLLPVILALTRSRHKSHHHWSTAIYPEIPMLKDYT